MSVLVAVTDNDEGLAALTAASNEAARQRVPLVAVNLTSRELDADAVAPDLPVEVVVPDATTDADEVELVLAEIESRPEVSLLVVGVRPRSPIGKAILGSIPQRLILESPIPVLSVKSGA